MAMTRSRPTTVKAQSTAARPSSGQALCIGQNDRRKLQSVSSRRMAVQVDTFGKAVVATFAVTGVRHGRPPSPSVSPSR